MYQANGMTHPLGSNAPGKLLENPDMKIIGQNYKYDYKVLYRWGISQPTIYFDTMVAAWLLDSTAAAFNMDRLAETYLNYTTIKYSDVVPKIPALEVEKIIELPIIEWKGKLKNNFEQRAYIDVRYGDSVYYR